MATITPQITTDPTIMAKNRANLVANINDPNGTTAKMGGGKVSDVGGNVVATPPTGNVITSDILKSNPTPVTLPTITTSPPPQTPIVTPPSGTIADQKTDFVSTIPTQKTEQQKYLESLGVPQALETLKTRGAVTAQLQNEAQLSQKREQAVRDYNTYLTAKQNLQQELEQIRAKPGGLVSGTNEEYNSALRRGNANLANLAIQSQLSQGLYDSARQTIKDKLDAQFQPLQDQIDYAFKAAQIYNNDPEIKAMAKRKETDYNNILKTTNDLHDSLLQNNAPQSVYSAVDKINNDFISGKINATEAQSKMIQASGIYGTSIKDQIDRANIAKIYAEVAKLKDNSTLLSIKDAQALGVPYGTTKGDAIAMGKVPGVQASAQELKASALQSAQDLLTKFESGSGTSAVGFSRSFGLQYIPGTAPADFQIQFDNLKSLLSLDNVKLLKGQGQVSDAERRLLSEASAKLNLSQSETEFKNALQDIIKGLSGNVNKEVTVQGNKFIVGQIYEDAKGNRGSFDSSGKWIPQ